MPLVAGVDSSTQATKVVVVDTDDGRVVARGRAAHTVTGRDGARESDPASWWDALATAMAATGRGDAVAAIAVGAQQHGLVVLDDAGDPLRPAKLWNDTQSAAQATALVEHFGASWWAEQVGVVPVPSITATKWAWLREHEPEVAARAATVCLPHDFLNLRLTGRAVTDRGDASGTGWWSSHHEGLESAVLEHLGLDPAQVPEVVVGGPAGEVTSAAAERLGIPAGIPVGPGSGDNAAAAMGLGLRSGDAAMSLGTSGTVFAVGDRPVVDPSGVVAGFADATDRHLPLACTLNCTLAVDRIAELLGLDREAVEVGGDAVVLPYLDGERTPNLPHARGSIVGLTHETTAGEILWGAYLGASHALLVAVDRIAELTGAVDEGTPLWLVGGGAAGTAWRRAIATLSGRPLRIPPPDEWVALGAAAQAASLVEGGSPYDHARRWAPPAEEIDPITPDPALGERFAAVAGDLEALNRREW